MIRKILTTVITLFLLQNLQGQIINGLDTLYGNEWINFDQSYFKIMVAEDGMYRIPWQTLSDAGLPLNQVNGNQFQLFRNGEQVPLYLTTDGLLGNSDYLEFFGKKNTSELDRHLFKDPGNEMINPLYSLITDTAAYFLTWTNGVPLRYQPLPNDLTNLPPKEEYYTGEHVLNYFSAFSKKANAQGVSSSDYGMTEGWSNAFANVQTITVNPANVYAGGPNGQLYLRYGSNIGQHQQLITLNDQPLLTDEFSDFQVRQLQFDIPNATLAAPMTLKLQGLAASTDRSRIANVILRYPATFNFSNQPYFAFELPASSVTRYLEISNFNAAGGTPVLYDLTNRTRLTAAFENDLVKIALPASANPVRLVLVNSNTGVKTVSTLKEVQFIDYTALDAEFIFLSNPRLYDDGNGINWVQEYANYRSSAAGGGYSTILVDVQQLYDQFGWGLNRHPLSIRNFGHFVKKEWEEVKYFFVVGKGREYTAVRTETQLSNANNASFFVPTFGVPGSDNWLVTESGRMAPFIPIGRLPVEQAQEINTYLNKVKQHQELINVPSTIEDRAWMKKVMHLGGGGPNEWNIIRNNLENMANVLTNSQYGADVHAFYKNSSDPVQISTNDAIFNLINTGVSVITFYGHSAVNTFDFNIDNPDNYKNKGKYPIMFSLGCYIGGIHTSTKGVSERFVLHDEGAALAFVASTGIGYVSSLYNYTRKSYELMGGSHYGQSLGQIIQATNADLESSNFGDWPLVQQITLNGDPAVKTSIFEGPDYTNDYSSVKLTPNIVNVTADSFELAFDVVNIGKSQLSGDTLEYRIEQQLPNNNRLVLVNGKMIVPLNRKKVKINLPTLGEESVGLNQLFITLDPDDKIEELPTSGAESNNMLKSPVTLLPGYTFYVQNNGAKAIYPHEFAIVGDQDLTLHASTYDPLVASQKYIFQLDTIETFDSPFLMQHELMQSGGLLKWKPGIPLQEEEVYYWRVSPDSISPQAGYNWSESSFVYLEGKEGWNQSDFGQYLENEYENMLINKSDRKVTFTFNARDVRLKNKVDEPNDPPQFVVSGQPIACPWPWVSNVGVQMIIMNPVLYYDWMGCPGNGAFGSVPSNNPMCPWVFRTNTLQERQNLIEFIENEIPDNWYVAFYTIQKNFSQDFKPGEWAADSISISKNLFSVLEAQGAEHIRELEQTGAVPYILIFQKNKGKLQEAIATDINDEITVEQTFPEYVTHGEGNSTLIGPVKNWKSLEWEISPVYSTSSDTLMVAIRGVNLANGLDSLVVDFTEEKSIDLSTFSSSEFPHLRLAFKLKNEERVAGQMAYWRVYSEGIPEFAINTNGHYNLQSDTLEQGELLKVSYQIENISKVDGDSLLILYKIIDSANKATKFNKKIKPLLKGDKILDDFVFETTNSNDQQTFEVRINPDYEQPELDEINNYLIDQFYVVTDKRNPVLDVTFDGQHVIDGALVSPTSLIGLKLTDENEFLLLKDTTYINVFIKRPGQELPDRISYTNPSLTFFPSQNGNKNEARIEYRGDFTGGENGEGEVVYELLVQARDATGNQSGGLDYKLTFKVNNQSALSNLINYPNPFSSSTRFLYTLTGRQTPTDYRLQIMTVSGRIVREVEEQELGPLKLGRHLTDFAWDGTDQYGDQLANGVYLYRFMINTRDGFEDNFYEIDRVDKYFTNGIGKMVLVR